MGRRKSPPDHQSLMFQGLPAIDLDRGREMLKAADFSVPDGWPQNWPWLVAMADAIAKADEHDKRAAQLRRSVGAFRDIFNSGDPWPGSEKNKDDESVEAEA